MNVDNSWQSTRRTFLIASCGLLLPRRGWSAPAAQPVLAWALDRRSLLGTRRGSDSRPEIIDGTGRLEWVGPVVDTQLPRLDGYSVWFEQRLAEPVALHGQFTLSAWIALESYPVNEASVIEWSDSAAAVRLSIDRLGFPHVSAGSSETAVKASAERRIERYRWVHLGATLSADGMLTLFVDGAKYAAPTTGARRVVVPAVSSVYVGRAQSCAVVAKVFPTGVLNGLLRELRVYDTCLSAAEVRELSREFKSEAAPLDLHRVWFADDPQRPKYHAMPPRAWTNEPHGLVHWRGQYHLFYQKNPNGPYWGHIHWGHMTSPDLLHWTEQPVALTPEPGPDSEGCWSGSVIVVDDKLHIFYTAGDGKRATICMATSEDGRAFTKHPGNPVIEAPPADIGVKEFRDPFVWRDGAEYRMIIGSGVEGAGGTALLYRSHDLVSWRFLKPLLVGDKQGSGAFWEMPVFMRIGNYHVLVVCEVPGRASYWVGRWEEDEFRVLSREPQRLDLLNHFLSPTPYTSDDGRVLAIGIVPDSRDSREAWQAGWAHLYGVPREFTLDEQGHLQQRPLIELSARFVTLVSGLEPLPLTDDWMISEATGSCGKLSVEFTRGHSDAVLIALRRSPDQREQTLLRYDWRSQLLTLDRTNSSLNPHVLRNVEQASYLPRQAGRITLDIFLDQSLLEVFVDDRACFSARIYPVLPESIGIAVRSEGGQGALARLAMQQALCR